MKRLQNLLLNIISLPTKEVIIIESEKRTDISDDGFKDICSEIGYIWKYTYWYSIGY